MKPIAIYTNSPSMHVRNPFFRICVRVDSDKPFETVMLENCVGTTYLDVSKEKQLTSEHFEIVKDGLRHARKEGIKTILVVCDDPVIGTNLTRAINSQWYHLSNLSEDDKTLVRRLKREI